jgi:hypothetical protein
MNEFFASTISMGTICLVGFVLHKKFTRAQKFQALSKSTEELLACISNMENPALKDDVLAPELPISDILVIYIKSRGNRNFANSRRFENESEDSDDNDFSDIDRGILLKWVERDHNLIKRLMFASLAGRLVDKIVPGCHSVYVRLLWTYGNQQAILNQLSEYLPHKDQQFISARV